MATKENFFRTSDGLYLYFEDTGGDRRPLILIPGFACSTRTFHRNIPVLAEHYRVITMDPRGHGRSMKVAGNNRLDRMAQDIKELIDYLDLKNVILIGHSLGGSQVAHYAEKCGEYKLSGIILADASLYAFGEAEWNQHQANHYNIDGWLQRVGVYMNSPETYAENVYKNNTAMEEIDREIFRDSTRALPPFCGAEFHLDTYHTDNMTPLANRTIPVGIMVTRSGYHNAWESGHEAVKRLVHSPLPVLYEFFGGNHMFPVLEAQRFNECILDFAAQVDRLEGQKP